MTFSKVNFICTLKSLKELIGGVPVHIIHENITNEFSHKACNGENEYARSWTALFRAFSSHRQPSASLTKLFPSWTRLLAELDKP